MSKKLLKAVLLAVCILSLAALTLIGCKEAAEEVEEAAEEVVEEAAEEVEEAAEEVAEEAPADITLNILETVESHGYALVELGKIYEEMTGVKVVVEQFPYEPTYEKEVLVLSGGGSDYDLMAYDCIWGQFFMMNGWLHEIDSFVADPDLPDVDFDSFATAPGFRSREGVNYGVPIDLTSPIMAYRKDMLEDAGLEGPPETWEEFAEYAEKLTKDTDDDGEIDQYGVVFHFGGPDSGFTDWIIRMSGYDLPPGESDFVINSDNTKSIFADHDYSTEAIEMILDIKEFAPPGAIGYDYPEASEAFNQGQAAMFITWQVFFFEAEDPEKSAVAGKLGYAPYPIATSQHNYVGGWQLGIPANSMYPEEAYKFLAWVASAEGQELMLENGSPTAYRKEALSDPDWIEKYPVMGAMGELNPIPLPLLPEFVEMQLICFENVGLAVAEQITPEEAVERAASETDAILGQ